AGRDRGTAWGGPRRGGRQLRRGKLWELSAAMLRRPMRLFFVPAAMPLRLQAGPRHAARQAVEYLLSDGPRNRHEAGDQNLLPRRSQDLLQEVLRDLLQDGA